MGAFLKEKGGKKKEETKKPLLYPCPRKGFLLLDTTPLENLRFQSTWLARNTLLLVQEPKSVLIALQCLLLVTLIKPARRNNLVHFIRVHIKIPLPRRMLNRPGTNGVKVATRVRRLEARDDGRILRRVDMKGNGRNIGVAHESLPQHIDAVVPVAKHGCLAVNGPVGESHALQTAVGLRVQQLAQVVEAVQLVPHVQLDQVVVCARDGERWAVELRGFCGGDFGDADFGPFMLVSFFSS